MGIDFGDRSIGIAISDPMGWTAQGIEVIHQSRKNPPINRLGELIKEYEVSKIVLGLPRRMDGTLGDRAEKSKIFAEELELEFSLPVELWDERFSTVSAERALLEADTRRDKRKKVIDKVAAVIILQNYLDAKGNNK